MSTSMDSSVDQVSAADLGTFGYHQQLSRRVGTYASFAAGFSFVSILTTVFQLFGLGYSFGGTAFFWTWPAVLAGSRSCCRRCGAGSSWSGRTRR